MISYIHDRAAGSATWSLAGRGEASGAIHPITIATDATNQTALAPYLSTIYTTQDHWIHYPLHFVKSSFLGRYLNKRVISLNVYHFNISICL